MSVTGRALLRVAVPMTGIILLGGLLAEVFAATTAVPPLGVVGEPLAGLTRSVALAVAIVYGVRADP